MHRFLRLWLIPVALFFQGLAAPIFSDAASYLQSGVPFDTYLSAMTYANAAIQVPDGAKRLTVSITNGSGDLDLYLKFGSPVSGGTLNELDADADARSDGSTSNETIVLTPTTSPPLRAGDWYVATLNLNNATTHFTLTATVETETAGSGIAVPTGQNLWVYPPTESCITNERADSSLPIGVGPVAAGGDTIRLTMATGAFAGPVDLYFAIYSTALDKNHLFLLHANGSLAPDSQGILPYLSAHSGSVQVNLFGDIPASFIPPGLYDLYLMITPAGDFGRYYLWNTSFVVQPGPGHVPDGNAGFFDGLLVAPNATILYQGGEYSGQANIGANALVGIVKEGKTYLYHPTLGNVPLSDETSRRAVGSFVFGLTTAALQGRQTASGAAPNQGQTLQPGASKELATGVMIERQTESLAKVRNRLYRWAAVKTSTGEGPYFLPPVGRTIDNNALRLLNEGMQLKTGQGFGVLSFNDVADITLAEGTVETYGSAWRALPSLVGKVFDFANAVSAYLGHGELIDTSIPGADLRLEKDEPLSVRLDRLDLGLQILEALKSFAAVADFSECAEVFVNSAVDFAEAIWSDWTVGQELLDPNNPVSERFWKTMLQDFVHDLGACTGNAASGFALTPITTFLDILGALSFTVENTVGDVQVYLKWAYDEMDFAASSQPETCEPYEGRGRWIMDVLCNSQWNECGFEKVLKFYEDHRYEFIHYSSNTVTGSGTWNLAGSTITLTPTDGKDCVQSYVGTMDSSCGEIKGQYVLGPKCANPGEVNWWKAQVW